MRERDEFKADGARLSEKADKKKNGSSLYSELQPPVDF